MTSIEIDIVLWKEVERIANSRKGRYQVTAIEYLERIVRSRVNEVKRVEQAIQQAQATKGRSSIT